MSKLKSAKVYRTKPKITQILLTEEFIDRCEQNGLMGLSDKPRMCLFSHSNIKKWEMKPR